MYRPPSPRRPSLLDLIILLILISGAGWLYYQATTNMDYTWDWSVIPQYLFRYDAHQERWVPNLLILGLMTTIRLSVWSTILATIIGIFMGCLRISKHRVRRWLGGAYVSLSRNLPPLVLVFIFYFFVGEQIMPFLGIEQCVDNCAPATKSILEWLFGPTSQLASFLTAVITLGIYEGAYITEIVRSGIDSVDQGQWEAGNALGFDWWSSMRFIILPQAVRIVLPPLAGQFISTIKDSAIVSVISIQELTFQGMELMAATYLTFEVWITITLMYFGLTFGCSLLARKLELALRRREQG
ncbi:amino acid ABC transporter permease [Desulfoplanes formicivorans]|uniref:Amino acid ABC transporter permease n=1 Tax=Desulfoplanes formicivorans TaxID=1592317 RepID=A0A194AGC4_9BACT|nr:amino acid ABC transporter permease [Desulfoplanes formicivorans]GAU07829.1 amino acid ABC transporter permease [Desulfoplanes formicivorans]